MKRIVLLFAAIVLLSGCTTTVYTKSGQTGVDFDKDREACELVVREDLAARGVADT